MNWQKPRKPTLIEKRGMVVFHCDDGRMTDYTKWTKTIQRAIYKNDQFHAKNNAVFSPCVNSGYLKPPYNGISNVSNGSVIMTEKEMKYIQDNGGEILSHGYLHSYFDYTPVTQTVGAGAESIFYDMRYYRFHPGQEAFIEEGDNKEYFIINDFVKNEPDSDNELIIDRPLQNSYTTAANLHLAENTLEDMTKGQKDYLATMGIECRNHINPWYRSSPLSDSYLQTHFNSVIKTSGYVEDPTTADVYSLTRLGGVENTSDTYFIEQLDIAEELDGVAFVQGHGGADSETLRRLEMIVDYAYEKNMKIVPHQEAVEHILNMQA